LPLQITPAGQFARAEGSDALIALIRAMITTTRNSWPHAPWFGLHERFLAINPDVEDQAGIADALNAAFAELGVHWARVHQFRSVRGGAYGERRFAVTLQVGDDARIVSAEIAT
jgi:hypothetical protein